MCDCYAHKCAFDGCDEWIPMHLEDFITPRSEIAVCCGKHIPKDKCGGTLWKYNDDDYISENPPLVKKCLIVPLSETAKSIGDGNHPNCARERVE